MLSGFSCLRSTSLLRNSCPMVHTSVFSYFLRVWILYQLNFSPAFLVCRRYPELMSSLNGMFLFTYYWHIIQLLSWKPFRSCRFIYLLHLLNPHQRICRGLITSSQIPIAVLWCYFTNIIAGFTSRQCIRYFEKYINHITVANITLLLQILPLHELSAVIWWFPIRTL